MSLLFSNFRCCISKGMHFRLFIDTDVEKLEKTPPVVYATDRSKAVVSVFFLFCVALWFILRGASCFKVFPCSTSWCFVIPFSIVITSLGEEGAGLCASRAFVCLLCTC